MKFELQNTKKTENGFLVEYTSKEDPSIMIVKLFGLDQWHTIHEIANVEMDNILTQNNQKND